MEKVFYAEMLPHEFRKAVERAPIAYLPLGTLEWHGEHMPLGADGIQSAGLFEQTAKRVGGVVCPMLFMGPDTRSGQGDGGELYGMDIGSYDPDPKMKYTPGKLDGSAYYLPVGAYIQLTENIVKQLSRAGFKILVAHGHGPSTKYFMEFAEYFQSNYGIRCVSCWFDELMEKDLGFQADHAAKNETSITMALRPELVEVERLPKDEWPRGVNGKDPRAFASEEHGKKVIEANVNRLADTLEKIMEEIK